MKPTKPTPLAGLACLLAERRRRPETRFAAWPRRAGSERWPNTSSAPRRAAVPRGPGRGPEAPRGFPGNSQQGRSGQPARSSRMGASDGAAWLSPLSGRPPPPLKQAITKRAAVVSPLGTAGCGLSPQ
jgi:hypothetical protein